MEDTNVICQVISMPKILKRYMGYAEGTKAIH